MSTIGSTQQTTIDAERSFPLNLWHLSILVLVVALGVSGYLSYLKIDQSASPTCPSSGVFDCGTVLSSAYSKILDVPIAWLGFGTNVLILGLLLLEHYGGRFFAINASILIFGLVFFAFVFSMYLIYIQAAVIGRYCPWCLTHEALIAVLFVASIFRLRNSFQSQSE